ncbi:MAG: formate--tetrahydrofolate ligase [Prolixibacteraceae bacterium]|nr:formate--tetrahydrofolate ligase [Prolixibacteraceae bacterium]
MNSVEYNGYKIQKIYDVADELGLDKDIILPHGHFIAKVPVSVLEQNSNKPDGKLILVTAMTPTPQGEGKTTTTIGLGDALRHLGHKTSICLREPSLGPYFGIKGGGTGAGKSQVMPAEDINLHFVGDMYSVSKANNLLAAMIDNHLQHGNELNIDPRRIIWRRVIDLNDRALRQIFIGMGGTSNGVPRQDGFNITPASEVMAMLCLARNFQDLGERLARTIVGFTWKGEPVRARDFEAEGAMQILLRDTIHPNLVQTMEGTPAFVHGGPFANIAQGTNTAIATRMALKLTDYVVTEAGFATDLGAEKFFDIKCRTAGLTPSAVVIVATIKAIKYHGWKNKNGGFANLEKHVDNIRQFGYEPIVAINRFDDDTEDELNEVKEHFALTGTKVIVSTHYSKGGEGAIELAEAVTDSIKKRGNKEIKFQYPLEMPVKEKIITLARNLYGAEGVDFSSKFCSDMELIERHGYGQLPICIAKSSKSLSDNDKLIGRPEGFKITVNEARVSAGAGFIVIICGNIMTMPGLPKVPAATKMKMLPDGKVIGLR